MIDGGTVRLPRLIGSSVAMDLVLTGRPVDAHEAHRIGLVNRLTAEGQTLSTAHQLARDLAEFPQTCLRHDRMSLLEQEGMTEREALANEYSHGVVSLESDTVAGAGRFTEGAGRHGDFERPT